MAVEQFDGLDEATKRKLVDTSSDVFFILRSRLDPAEAGFVLVLVMSEIAKLEHNGDGTKTVDTIAAMTKNVLLGRNIMTGII